MRNKVIMTAAKEKVIATTFHMSLEASKNIGVIIKNLKRYAKQHSLHVPKKKDVLNYIISTHKAVTPEEFFK